LNGGGLRVDSKEAQGLFNKTATAEGVSSNQGCWIWIERFGRIPVRTVRSKRRGSDGPVCTAGVWTVRSGSDQSDLVGLTGTAGLHGGACRRMHDHAVLGTGAVANGRVRVRSAHAR
jgi:hypothetical protein